MAKHLLVLHGALGSKDQFAKWDFSAFHFDFVHTMNFIGHGGSAIPEKILMPDLCNQIEQFIRSEIGTSDSLTIFGYSMGGYAALLLASRSQERIERIVTLGTKLFWNKDIALKETGMLDPGIIESKVPAFANELRLRHQPQDWKTLLDRTAEMMYDLGANHYLHEEVLSRISIPVKLMLGDKDKMVTLDETLSVFKKLPNASLSVLPSTPHPIEKVSVERIAFELNHP